MPELPEVETTVRGLKTKVLKRAFIDVWTDWEKIVKKPDFKKFRKEIKNKKIQRIWRRGKNIIFDLSPTIKSNLKVGDESHGYSLLIHQKLTGHLLYGTWDRKTCLPAGRQRTRASEKNNFLKEKVNTYIHLIFFLDNGKMLALSDLRKFAKVELWKTEELLNSKEFRSLGSEPLDKDFTFEKFKETIKGEKGLPAGRQGKIKQVLMDQNVIAGIGNIYSNEALWRAKIHPQKEVAKLNEKEFKLLYQAIKKVLELAVKLGGESFSDYRKVDGSKGEFDTERKVYQREGQKCSRCGTKIKRIKFGGRSAFFCPHCQKL